jgi:hypothetical protein
VVPRRNKHAAGEGAGRRDPRGIRRQTGSLDFEPGRVEQYSASAAHLSLLSSLLRAGGVSLRVYRADDGLVRSILLR